MNSLMFGKVGRNIEEGFLFDKIIRVMNYNHVLNSTDKEVIERGFRYLNNVLEGSEQVDTGRLKRNAVESVNVYTRAIIACTQFDKDNDFKNFIRIVKDELKEILENDKVVVSRIDSSYKFFKIMKKYSVNELGRFLYDKNEAKEWIIQTM